MVRLVTIGSTSGVQISFGSILVSMDWIGFFRLHPLHRAMGALQLPSLLVMAAAAAATSAVASGSTPQRPSADRHRQLRYDDARIAEELGSLLEKPLSKLAKDQPSGPDFQQEYPVLAKNGVTLEGVTYALEDYSLPWRLVRNYAQMQLFTFKMAAGNPVMRAAISHHNALRVAEFLSRLERMAARKQPSSHNMHIVQASGFVSEVNVYVILTLLAALVALFTSYCAYVVVGHAGQLIGGATQPQRRDKEQQCLLPDGNDRLTDEKE
ncbi:hypothetical protein HPB47_020852 [Ixodes persulcatus]|uniref:Uncharacterized protein n=1 Tax=Ixodes persulcatus TaxID=34615 RepID=A0AC60QGN5_IXOPE|nr:hypothetical protein HPB47_020852 [Ixodes persulcatus]